MINNRGVSLIEAVVALGLFGMLTYATVDMTQKMLASRQKIEQVMSRQEVLYKIRDNFSCARTVHENEVICNGKKAVHNQYIDLYAKNGVLLPANGRQGIEIAPKLFMRAKCIDNRSDGNFEFFIEDQ